MFWFEVGRRLTYSTCADQSNGNSHVHVVPYTSNRCRYAASFLYSLGAALPLDGQVYRTRQCARIGIRRGDDRGKRDRQGEKTHHDPLTSQKDGWRQAWAVSVERERAAS